MEKQIEINYLQTNLKHDLKVESEKLRRRNTVQERRYINRQFKIAQKKFIDQEKKFDRPYRGNARKNEVERVFAGKVQIT